MKRFFSIPAQLTAIILAVLLFGGMVPISFIQGCYTFSSIFKEFLGALLPFMVFFFVVTGILSFRKNAPLVLGIMLSCIFVSNAFVALVSYVTMMLFGSQVVCDTAFTSLVIQAEPIHSLISFSIPLPFNGIHALIAALVVGIVCSFVSVPWLERFFLFGKKWIEYCVSYFFIPLLPFYILGFLLKIRAEGMFVCLLEQYGAAFMLIIALQVLYLSWLYFIASEFSIRAAWEAIKVAFPSYITAFSTMSSAAAIPVSIKAAEENTGNRELASVAMPIMANVHLLGDSIVTPILAMVTMTVFLGVLPGFVQYLSFVFYFCMTMFAVSGIPGGGILVMIPILKSQLGFTGEMVNVIMTIYFLLDAFGTGANVMGDGALVMIVNKVLKRVGVTN